MSAPLLVDEIRPRPAARTAPAERRVPAGMLFTLLLGVLLALAMAHVLDPRTLPIRHVRINGEFRHLAPAALQAAASDAVRGGFFNVNVDAVRLQLMREPWVRDVTVRRVWPDTLSLQVVEQEPIARWGEAALLNAQALRFAPDRASWPQGLPQLGGPDGSEALLLRRFRTMQQALAPHGLLLDRLELDERRSWTLGIRAGPRVILGRRDYLSRFERFSTVIPGYVRDNLGRMAVVDMRYTNGFAVRWKQTAPAATTRQGEHGEES